MRKRRSFRMRRSRRPEEQAGAAVETQIGPEPAGPGAQPERLGPYYNAGPVHDLAGPASAQAPLPQAEDEAGPVSTSPEREEEAMSRLDTTASPQRDQAVEQVASEPLPSLEGSGQPTYSVDFAGPASLRLRGRTDIHYDGGAFHTENVTAGRGADCTGCSGVQCLHVTGTLVATYSVTTTVTLPSVSDFPQHTPCQQRRVQDAITNVLAPHEQQHVTAVQSYNGTTRRTFDLNLCRNRFDSAIQEMFQQEESARRQAAQAASDALDPFYFDVDLNCEEPRQPRRQSAGAEGVPAEEEE